MKPEIEKLFLRRVIFNGSPIIDQLLPGMFTLPECQALVYMVKLLKENKIKITKNNVLTLYVKERTRINSFFKKRWIKPELNSILEIVDDSIPERPSDEESLKEFFNMIKENTFQRFVDGRIEDIKKLNEISGKSWEIIAMAKSILKVYDILNNVIIEKDWITESAKEINAQRTIPTFSKLINRYIFGWSRGYPNAIMARSSHGKSTFITNEVKYQIENGLKVYIISPEENEITFWQRIFCNEFNIDMLKLKTGAERILPEHIDKVKQKYTGKLIFLHKDMVYYNNLISALYRIKDADIIFIDHINAIKYPGGGNDIANMPGGIISLINAQKNYLNNHKNTTIINVNQVSEKQISNIPTYWKMPDYTMAYGNTVSYFAAREWITLYYPYRDLINRPLEWSGVVEAPGINELYFAVEKSSTGTIGGGVLNFIPQYAKITDMYEYATKKESEVKQEELFNEIINKKRQN